MISFLNMRKRSRKQLTLVNTRFIHSKKRRIVNTSGMTPFSISVIRCSAGIALSHNITLAGNLIKTQKLHLIMSIDFESLHQQIMNLDPCIRLVTICTDDGKIMYSGYREGIRNLLTSEESKRSLELSVNTWKLRGELAPKIGRGRYVLAEYERIKRITMPLTDNIHLVYITTDIPSDHNKIINGIMQLKL